MAVVSAPVRVVSRLLDLEVAGLGEGRERRGVFKSRFWSLSTIRDKKVLVKINLSDITHSNTSLIKRYHGELLSSFVGVSFLTNKQNNLQISNGTRLHVLYSNENLW